MSNMYLAFIGYQAFVIDPSVSPEKVSSEVSDITAILITHGHYDHIKFVEEWHQKFPKAPVYMSPEDSSLLGNHISNCSYMDNLAKVFDFPYEKAEGTITFGSVNISVLKTPGHTMGSVCYLFTDEGKEYLFTGDTVFAGSVGRTDMDGGSYELLKRSIEDISKLSPDMVLLPGHGPQTTLKNETAYNPFFE